MDWPNENVIRFLELYQARPCIWDPNNVGHKNKTRLRDAWREIVEEMGEPYTLQELKRKKESLMSAYRCCRVRVKRSQMEGNVYTPTWYAYTQMDSFLGEIYRYEPVQPVKIEDRQSVADSNYGQDDSSSSSSESDPLKHKPIGTPRAIKRKHNFVPQTSTNTQEFNASSSVLSEQKIDEDNDECLLFSKLVEIKLRKLSDERREFVMLKINEVFYNEYTQRGEHSATAEY